MEKSFFENLDRQHLLPENRENMNTILNIMDKDYCEITASGKIYHYDDYVSLDTLDLETKEYEIISYQIEEINKETVLSIYEIIEKKSKLKTLRSSLWVQTEGQWKLKFHQGTKSE